jgi:hypothetical protein
MINKNYLIIGVVALMILITGCSKKLPATDRPDENGNYHYINKDLDFSLVLPPDFSYYQTQRKSNEDYTDIEFYIPTSDLNYHGDVPNYARIVVVRIFGLKTWEKIADSEKSVYGKVGEKDERVYTIKFWEITPADWQDKWSDDIKNSIIKNFMLI